MAQGGFLVRTSPHGLEWWSEVNALISRAEVVHARHNFLELFVMYVKQMWRMKAEKLASNVKMELLERAFRIATRVSIQQF